MTSKTRFCAFTKFKATSEKLTDKKIPLKALHQVQALTDNMALNVMRHAAHVRTGSKTITARDVGFVLRVLNSVGCDIQQRPHTSLLPRRIGNSIASTLSEKARVSKDGQEAMRNVYVGCMAVVLAEVDRIEGKITAEHVVTAMTRNGCTRMLSA